MSKNIKESSNDDKMNNNMNQFSKSLDKIENMIELLTKPDLYDSLSNVDKIRYNLLLSFSLNSLYWINLKIEGVDPATHGIKSENDRLKKAMARSQEINDKRTLMPRINKDAAQRFVRNSLFTLKDNCDIDEPNDDDDEDDGEDWDYVSGSKPHEIPSVKNDT